jgi:hypothetical protein
LANKRGFAVDRTLHGKTTKFMAVADITGIPFAAHVESASSQEVNFVKATIETSFVVHTRTQLIGEKAPDSGGLDQHLKRAAALR